MMREINDERGYSADIFMGVLFLLVRFFDYLHTIQGNAFFFEK